MPEAVTHKPEYSHVWYLDDIWPSITEEGALCYCIKNAEGDNHIFGRRYNTDEASLRSDLEKAVKRMNMTWRKLRKRKVR